MAKLAASKLGSNYVGTEHLLIAIIEDGESFAVRFLQMLGVDPQSVANALSSALSDGYTVDKASGNAYPKDENGEKEGGSALEKFGRDLTKLAAEGKIDPSSAVVTRLNVSFRSCLVVRIIRCSSVNRASTRPPLRKAWR